MDGEKSITEKLTDAISKAADSVKNAVSHAVDSASNAAQHAMEANAEKISRIPPARTDPERVAATTNEQVYIPEAIDAAAMPMPLVPMAPAPKKLARAKTAPATPGKMAKRSATKKASAKKPATKSAKKAATKTAAKKIRKVAKKPSVRSSKKAKRKSKK
jgi:ribonuclease E